MTAFPGGGPASSGGFGALADGVGVHASAAGALGPGMYRWLLCLRHLSSGSLAPAAATAVADNQYKRPLSCNTCFGYTTYTWQKCTYYPE